MKALFPYEVPPTVYRFYRKLLHILRFLSLVRLSRGSKLGWDLDSQCKYRPGVNFCNMDKLWI